jgi:hypothetical protein
MSRRGDRRGGTVEGRLMVRLNGEWVEANVDSGLRMRQLQGKETTRGRVAPRRSPARMIHDR